mgnify:FL=1
MLAYLSEAVMLIYLVALGILGLVAHCFACSKCRDIENFLS